MGVLSTTLIALGAATAAAAGSVISYRGQQKTIEAQQKQDAVRRDASELEANRRRREIMRQSAMARATALATANSQGAASPGGSALPGAYGQIQGQATANLQGVYTSQEQTGAMFGLQNQVFAGQSQSALGGTISSIGSGVMSLGGALGQSQTTLNQIGGNKGFVPGQPIQVTQSDGRITSW